MREIKFIAWDKFNECMTEIDGMDLYIAECKVFEIYQASRNYDSWLEKKDVTERYIPLQYTGLKDKNGKEIYEGYILKGDNMYQELYGNPVISIGEYIDSGLVCPDLDNENVALFGVYITVKNGEQVGLANDRTTQYFEVIGNIYENPELLDIKE